MKKTLCTVFLILIIIGALKNSPIEECKAYLPKGKQEENEELFWQSVLIQSAEILKIGSESFEMHQGLLGEYYEAKLSENKIIRITKENYNFENGKKGLSATVYIIDTNKGEYGKRNIIKIFQDEGE